MQDVSASLPVDYLRKASGSISLFSMVGNALVASLYLKNQKDVDVLSDLIGRANKGIRDDKVIGVAIETAKEAEGSLTPMPLNIYDICEKIGCSVSMSAVMHFLAAWKIFGHSAGNEISLNLLECAETLFSNAGRSEISRELQILKMRIANGENVTIQWIVISDKIGKLFKEIA
jgi:hypothetical protein